MGKTSLTVDFARLALTSLLLPGCAALLERDKHAEARAMSEALVEQRRAEDAASREREVERGRREEVARRAREAEKAAAKQREEQERAQKHEESCASTRVARLAQAKADLREHYEWVRANQTRLEYFGKHCEVYDSRGIKVSRERVRDGVILRTQSVGDEEDVKCDGAAGRPKGIDASWLSEVTERSELVVSPGISHICGASDEAALGTTLVITPTEREAAARVLALPDP